MTTDSTVVDDPLTSILRDGARRLLAQAVEAEAEAFLAAMRTSGLPMAGLVSCGTAMGRNG